jgi:hypothetical protein
MSDSDSDSDYTPNDAEVQTSSVTSKPTNDITAYRRGNAEQMLSEMKQHDFDFVLGKKTAAIGKRDSHAGAGTLKSTSSRSQKKKLQVLASIFGKAQASTMTNCAVSRKRPRENSAQLKQAALEAARNIQKSVKVSETVKFAGKEVAIEKTVLSQSRPLPPVLASSGIDKVLDELKGPKVISTITKSLVDWDSFKEKEGLQEDLSTASKGQAEFLLLSLICFQINILL